MEEEAVAERVERWATQARTARGLPMHGVIRKLGLQVTCSRLGVQNNNYQTLTIKRKCLTLNRDRLLRAADLESVSGKAGQG